MNNQDERFWSEFPEDELQDPATRRVLAALRDVYRSDDDDQQSVQRVWQRITMNSAQQQQPRATSSTQQHISRFTLPTSFTRVGAYNPTHSQRSSARRRVDILVALGIIFLVVGSMLGIIAYRQSGSARTAGHSTPPVASPRLGTTLGQVSLGMSRSDPRLNRLCVDPYPIGGSLLKIGCTTYSGYIEILFNNPDNASNKIVQLDASKGFSGETAEGLRWGMSLNQFYLLYKQFRPESFTFKVFQQKSPQISLSSVFLGISTVVSVKDAYGTTLVAAFYQSRLIEIMLR